MRWLAIPLLLLAGCTDPTYAISGAFEADRSDADMQELERLGVDHGGDVRIMESFPEQFVISDMNRSQCEELHAILLDKDYLGSVGACTAEQGSSAYSIG